MAAGCGHQSGAPHRRLLLRRRDGVRVGVERDRDGGVPKALGDNLGMDASLKRESSVCVPQVVQADARQQRPLHRLAEAARHRLGVEGKPERFDL